MNDEHKTPRIIDARDVANPIAKYKYSTEAAQYICDRLSEGESLSAICREMKNDPKIVALLGKDNIPTPGQVNRWVNRDVDDFATRFAEAKNVGLDTLADSALDLGNLALGKLPRGTDRALASTMINGEIQRRKLLFEIIKWQTGVQGRKFELPEEAKDGSNFAVILMQAREKAINGS